MKSSVENIEGQLSFDETLFPLTKEEKKARRLERLKKEALSSRTWDGLTQFQWKVKMKDLLLRSDSAKERAVFMLYRRQTDDERIAGRTFESNDFGFDAFDAPVLSSIGKKISSGRHYKDLTLDEQIELIRRLPKYWKQLMKMSKEKTEERNGRSRN